MLDSVLVARDRFLRPGGAILPDIANLYVALGSFESEGLSFWNDIYGLSMRPVAETIRSHRTYTHIYMINALLYMNINFTRYCRALCRVESNTSACC